MYKKIKEQNIDLFISTLKYNNQSRIMTLYTNSINNSLLTAFSAYSTALHWLPVSLGT